MARVTKAAHVAGALTVWISLDSQEPLTAADADFVGFGCGYKYLCTGPGWATII